jgi:hypothetical protein
VLEFDARGWGCELPVGLGVICISVVLPGGDFVDEGLFILSNWLKRATSLGSEEAEVPISFRRREGIIVAMA